MQACNDGVESIGVELSLQKIAIAEEARKKAEEEVERRRLEEERKEEARSLTARLKELGIAVTVGVADGVANGDNDEEGSMSDSDLVVHDPVRF